MDHSKGTLLEAVATGRAAVVLIDMTSVRVINAGVVERLVKTVADLRLLGAEVVLSGVSLRNARKLIQLGVDLSRVTSSLAGGLRLGFMLTRRHRARARA